MMHNERLDYLIRYLLSEDERYAGVSLPQSEEERFRLYRSLVNVRMPKKISAAYLKEEDAYLQELLAEKGVNSIEAAEQLCEDIYLWQGDITTLKADAIVNAANSKMLGCFCPCHACIDNCIHTFAGVRLRLKCDEIMRAQGADEPTGSAKITPSYNLPSRYVLHTVGPIVYGTLTDKERKQLASCYTECLKLADAYALHSVAFCCISTGEFHFPNREAADIAFDTVKEYKRLTNSKIKIIFNVFKDSDYALYRAKKSSE